MAVLFITLPSADLDECASAKAEVRFKDATAVRSLLVGALSAKMRDASIMATADTVPPPFGNLPAMQLWRPVKLHMVIHLYYVTDRQATYQPVARRGTAMPHRFCPQMPSMRRWRLTIPSKVMIYLPVTPTNCGRDSTAYR